MKKITLFIIALALLLGTLPSQTASAATKYNLTVTNYINNSFIIELTDKDENSSGGYDKYDIKVPRLDEVTKELPKGEYTYVYTVCQTTYTGTLNLKKDDVTWEILPCGVQPSKMRFNSHLSDTLVVNMYGPLEMPEPEDQEFEVELGGNPIPDILSGTYVMTYEVACSTVGTDPKTVFTEEIRVAKSGTTQVILRSCEWYAHPARTYDKPVPVKFQIVNHAPSPSFCK